MGRRTIGLQHRHIIEFARQNSVLVGVFAISLVAVIWFGIGAALDFLYFHDPKHRDQALKGWMTPRYVGLSYDLPRPVVLEVLEIEPGEGRRKRLDDIADELGLSLPELTERVRSVAEAHRENDE